MTLGGGALDPAEQKDSDGDGIGDKADPEPFGPDRKAPRPQLNAPKKQKVKVLEVVATDGAANAATGRVQVRLRR